MNQRMCWIPIVLFRRYIFQTKHGVVAAQLAKRSHHPISQQRHRERINAGAGLSKVQTQ